MTLSHVMLSVLHHVLFVVYETNTFICKLCEKKNLIYVAIVFENIKLTVLIDNSFNIVSIQWHSCKILYLYCRYPTKAFDILTPSKQSINSNKSRKNFQHLFLTFMFAKFGNRVGILWARLWDTGPTKNLLDEVVHESTWIKKNYYMYILTVFGVEQ